MHNTVCVKEVHVRLTTNYNNVYTVLIINVHISYKITVNKHTYLML